jgi:hypothetical protein
MAIELRRERRDTTNGSATSGARTTSPDGFVLLRYRKVLSADGST